ncbi:MAG TPA: transglycosylase domain-containing protein [Ktedonobacterales bacterium]|nr:transglycosylase domain-containing protein [Ktedonobacterales bacterium]
MDSTGNTPSPEQQEPQERADQQPEDQRLDDTTSANAPEMAGDEAITRPSGLRDGAQNDALDTSFGGSDETWPAFIRPSPASHSVSLNHLNARRWSRKRRRYSMFVKRSVRARQTARSSSIARAAWASTIVILALIAVVLTSVAGAAAAYYRSELGLIKGLQQTVSSKDSVRIFDDKGALLYEFDDSGAQHSITIAHIPVAVVNATVAIEDHDFWVNNGVDFTSILRAAVTDLKSSTITQGGSTITQQLVKSQLLQDSNTTFTRKLREAILSVGITSTGEYSKQQIMEMYLNSIPYSDTAYGIDAAAHEYFGYTDDPATGMTAAQHLDLAQASMLAGVPQNPNTNDPLKHPEAALARQTEVLNAMVKYGYITQAQMNQAVAEAKKPNFYHSVTTEQNLAPHFVYFVKQQLEDMINTGQLQGLSRSGLNVYTTLDLDLQNHTQQFMKDHLYGTDRAGYPPYPLIQDSNLTNSAAVLAEQSTGDIKVMLGSVDYYSTKIDGKFDVATQGYRQPGSAFKPIVYATAFEKGWFPAMAITDLPTAFWDPGQQKAYKPLDFNPPEFRGELSLRTALQWSLNIPAVKTMQFAGVDAVEQNAMRMGITKWAQGSQWGLSSVLGSLDVTPYEMAQAYTVFANYGQYIPLHAINSITDSAGNVLFQYHTPAPVQVMDPRIAFMITSILSDNNSRAGDFGICSPLYLYNDYYGQNYNECLKYGGHPPDAWPAAAKTGTGQNFTDDWTMGYTMNYTLAVWAGNNNNTSMIDIDGVTGAAPIWHNTMYYAMKNLPRTPFPAPTGMHKAQYCSDQVCTTDWFLNGPPPPQGLTAGTVNSSLPCITEPNTGGWEYSTPPNCVGFITPGQSLSAP